LIWKGLSHKEFSFVRKQAAVCKSTYPTDSKLEMWAQKTGKFGVLAIINITERITPTPGSKSLSYSIFKITKAMVFTIDMKSDLSS
jgi:hypothetical protein